ncbi:hypothetical protein ANCDUO_20678, partial [Ancylostoma duodenale]
PNMTPEAVDKLVIDHLNNLWKQRGSPNHFKPIAYHSGNAWLADYKDDNFRAGARAMKRVSHSANEPYHRRHQSAATSHYDP